MSTADYKDAAERHMADAELLMAQRRWANADHLFGIASECAIKQVMISLGMAKAQDGGPLDRGHRVHMPDLLYAFQTFAQGRLASRYLQPLSQGAIRSPGTHSSLENPFGDWLIDQRYSHQSDFTEAIATAHQAAANECMACIVMRNLDGGMD
jgi:hypothetical protein